ncbi:hypothetical protein VPH35_136832 [Triticum aestivum]|uniref:Uncharacterized protein n=1 Tax=Triticum aestivum TaxID=4565 RepID=A0A3B6TPD5_WHEAT
MLLMYAIDFQRVKMDAIAFDPFQPIAYRFSENLRAGSVHLFKKVGFEPAAMHLPVALPVPCDFYIVLHSRTEVLLARASINIPSLPPRFIDFIDAYSLRNRMLAGALYHLTMNFADM